jgi:hypothetical protein
MRHDVRALCLQTQAECDAGFETGRAYRDPERPDGLFSFTAGIRETYLRGRSEHFSAVASQCRQHDIPTTFARIEQPPGDVLRAWLRQPGRA